MIGIVLFTVASNLTLPNVQAIRVPVSNGSAHLSVHLYGSACQSGSPITIVVPGFMGVPSSPSYDNTLLPLASLRCVLQYDLRGVGDSSKERIDGHGHAMDLVALKSYCLATLSAPFVQIIGISLGGHILASACRTNCTGVDRMIYAAAIIDFPQVVADMSSYLDNMFPSFGLPLRIPSMFSSPAFVYGLNLMSLSGGVELACRGYVDRTSLPCLRVIIDAFMTTQIGSTKYNRMSIDVLQNIMSAYSSISEIRPRDFSFGNTTTIFLHGTEDQLVRYDGLVRDIRHVPSSNKFLFTITASHLLMGNFDSFSVLLETLTCPLASLINGTCRSQVPVVAASPGD